MSCNPESRYEILTFFFDGVPRPGGAGLATTPGGFPVLEPMGVMADVDLTLNQAGNSQHRASRDCRRCHEEGSRWARMQLHNSLPQLCYECHTDYNAVRGYVHGPVAVGACLFCHDPHRSSYLRLLKAPQPDLCYQCHDIGDISAIPDHREELDGVCTRCHEAHISLDSKLLKPQIKK